MITTNQHRTPQENEQWERSMAGYDARVELRTILFPVVALARELNDGDPEGWRLNAFSGVTRKACHALREYIDGHGVGDADTELRQVRGHLQALAVMSHDLQQTPAGCRSPDSEYIDALMVLSDEMRERWCGPIQTYAGGAP